MSELAKDGYIYQYYSTGVEFGDNRKIRDWADRAKHLMGYREDWEHAFNAEIERYIELRITSSIK